MIGRLRGTLVEKRAPQLLVDVNGVGYDVDAPMSTFYVLPELGHEITLLTHLVVREDNHTLYGFATEAERKLFRSLIKVNGVGEGFVGCVQQQDTAALVKLPGVGKKTAERLIVEMRDRIKDWEDAGVPMGSIGSLAAEVVSSTPAEDAVSALIALGYKPPEASRMVRGVDCEDLPSEQIIRLALQSTVK
jgi:Holliday junction DNA helicase RuvA